MTGLTETRTPRSALPPARIGQVLLVGLGVLVLVVVLRLLLPLFEGPGHVDRLVVVNPTDYEITVAASEPGERARSPLGSVDPGEEAVFERVVDQGDEWVFHFRSQGRDAGSLEVSEAELEADDWRLPIPGSVGEALAAEGVPTPR